VFAEREEDREIDVEELLRLARDRSADARAQLAEIVSDLFFDTSRTLSERERSTMSDILRQLIHDVETSVRKHLAIRLSDEPNAPRPGRSLEEHEAGVRLRDIPESATRHRTQGPAAQPHRHRAERA